VSAQNCLVMIFCRLLVINLLFFLFVSKIGIEIGNKRKGICLWSEGDLRLRCDGR
jgi:hypothetical protein